MDFKKHVSSSVCVCRMKTTVTCIVNDSKEGYFMEEEGGVGKSFTICRPLTDFAELFHAFFFLCMVTQLIILIVFDCCNRTIILVEVYEQ